MATTDLFTFPEIPEKTSSDDTDDVLELELVPDSDSEIFPAYLEWLAKQP